MNKEKIEDWVLEHSEVIACTALVFAGGLIGAAVASSILIPKINIQANILADVFGSKGHDAELVYTGDGKPCSMDSMVQEFHVKQPEVKDIYRMVIIH